MTDNETSQAGPLDAKAMLSRGVDEICANIFAPAKKDCPPIDADEQERRQIQVDASRANYMPSGLVDVINRRYIDGELDGDERAAAIRLFALEEHNHA